MGPMDGAFILHGNGIAVTFTKTDGLIGSFDSIVIIPVFSEKPVNDQSTDTEISLISEGEIENSFK